MPALSWSGTEIAWLSWGRRPTKAESWVPMEVMLEYWRVQSSEWPLQAVCAEMRRV